MSEAKKAPSTVGEWDQEIAQRTTSELNRHLSALSALRSWEAFNEAFKWTRMFVLIDSIQQELDRREVRKDG